MQSHGLHFEGRSILKHGFRIRLCADPMAHYFGYPYDKLNFHWPVYGLRDDAYCTLFVEHARKSIHRTEMDIRKCDYLLAYNEKSDISEFLKNLGYEPANIDKLRSHILCNTYLNILTYSHYLMKCFRCVAQTNLNGKCVTTVWELRNDFTIRFITLIPGGDKRWK